MNCEIKDCPNAAKHEAIFTVAEQFKLIKGADSLLVCQSHLTVYKGQQSFLRSQEL